MSEAQTERLLSIVISLLESLQTLVDVAAGFLGCGFLLFVGYFAMIVLGAVNDKYWAQGKSFLGLGSSKEVIEEDATPKRAARSTKPGKLAKATKQPKRSGK